MLSLKSAADVHDSRSFSNRMRSRRFSMFEALVRDFPRPLRILDVGGTNLFWEQRGWAGNEEVQITTLNLFEDEIKHSNIVPVKGDATNMAGIDDNEFDVAFSNSVIEHLFTFENQKKMAREVQRVARAYWVQTPNFWFPMEPHFHVPGWQWMPKSARVALIRRRQCGWRGPCPDPAEAREAVDEVRLMSRRELRQCFPHATIWAERMFGLVKSWVCYGGFGPA